jgi:hypothetical protein
MDSTTEATQDTTPNLLGATTYMALYGGKNVIVRTVTYHYTGRLVGVIGDSLVLDGGAWIADSGRWSKALASGKLDEVEMYPTGPVVVSAIVDVTEWRHELPRVTR